MRKLLMLLLLPSLLWAGTVTVKKAEKIQQPAGTIDRVSKRTANGKVFEFDHIGSGRFVSVISIEPMHYLDSTGVYRDYEFDSEPDTVAGFTVVRTGKFDVAYDSTGRIRWQKKDALLTISPAFSRTNVDINFNINRRGLKAEYVLKNASAPSVLKWLVTANDTVEDAGGGKGKGNLKKASKVMGQIAEFTAKDATGKVVSLSAIYKRDSLIVTLDTAGVIYPITVDPTIQDTIIAAQSGDVYVTSGANWLASRNTADGGTATAGEYFAGRQGVNAYRSFFNFSLKEYSVAIVDSVRLYFLVKGKTNIAAGDSVNFRPVIGTFGSTAPATAWFNDFHGWAASGAYGVTNLTTNYFKAAEGDSAWKSELFTAAACDSVETYLATDTLKMAVLAVDDISGDSASFHGQSNALAHLYTYPPYLVIYTTTSLPGVTTVSDTSKSAYVLYATIDSISATARGFKYWKSGGALASDTVTLSKSGTFSVGAFQDSTKGLFADSVYLYKGFATNLNGTAYGAIDSFTATTTSGGTDTLLVRRGGFGGKFSR